MSVDGDSLRFQRNVIERIQSAIEADPCVAIESLGDLLVTAGEAIKWERACANAFLWGSPFPKSEGQDPCDAFEEAFTEVFC